MSRAGSRRSMAAMATVLALAVMCLVPAGALAAKGVVGGFGGVSATPALGGAFGATSPRGVAVNGVSGDVYVVDGGNNRVQRFNSSGAFVSAWGFDVIQPGGTGEVGAPQNERQSVTLTSIFGVVNGGTFTLTFNGQTTGSIAYNATAAAVDAALEGLSNVGAGNVAVTGANGGPWTVEFTGTLAGVNVGQMTGDASSLTGTGVAQSVEVATTTEGGATPSFEVCTVAAECKTGASSAVGGGMNAPHGVAVDQSDGSVYVTDGANFRVQKFSATGVFERAWGWNVDTAAPTTFEVCTVAASCKIGVSGAGDGQFATTFNGHLAVEPSSGNVYVADPGATANRRFQRFSGLGAFQAKFGATGTGDGQFGAGSPSRVAIDGGGTVYAVDVGNNRVQKLTPFGSTFIPTTFSPANLSGASVVPFAIAVDPIAHRVFVARRATGGTSEVWVQELDTEGNLLATHGQGAGIGAGLAATTMNQNASLAYNRQTGALYLSIPDTARRVLVLDDEAPAQPTATMDGDDVTAVGPRTATFNGSVNPNGTGLTTGYRFEYAPQGTENWTSAPSSDVNVGNGTADVTAGPTTVTGLLPNQTYKVRLVATRQFQAPVRSAEQTFTTDALAPEDVATLSAFPIRATSARLRGTLNANNAETTFHFEYGADTAYGSQVPVPGNTAGSGKTVTVTQWLTGLEPGATYHYRLVASNSEGTVEGADMSFVADPAPEPPVQRAYELVTPPDKITRRGAGEGVDGLNGNPGLPSGDGESMMLGLDWAGLDRSTAAVVGIDPNRFVRTDDGWVTRPVFNNRVFGFTANAQLKGQGANIDQSMSGWGAETIFPFPEEEVWGNGFSSYLRFFDGAPAWAPHAGGGLTPRPGWAAMANQGTPLGQAHGVSRFSDDGRYHGFESFGRGLAGPGDPTVAGQLSGHSGYRQDLETGLLEPLHGCTGKGGDTLIPARIGTGIASDVIGTQSCSPGAITSPRGSSIGPSAANVPYAAANFTGELPDAMSADGERLFFMSPDPSSSQPPLATQGCTTATGAASLCQPQLYVRQWDSSGDPVVRWISRPQLAGQPVAMLGRGAAFEAASRDGSTVYFRTNAPLTADDPNAGSATAAQGTSWDLYRYELPSDRDADPGSGALTRITAGPTAAGTGTLTSGSPTVSSVATTSGQFVVGQTIRGTGVPLGTTISAVGADTLTLSANATAPGSGVALTAVSDPNTGSTAGAGVVRHISEDGTKVYLATASPIRGADDESPLGSAAANVPGGTPADSAARNLYLFDASKSGSARWKFVARMPTVSITGSLAGCAMAFTTPGPPIESKQTSLAATSFSCVRGSADGRLVVFMTAGQLTADDTDSAVDVYAYDAEQDRLTRVTAPQDGAPGGTYACVTDGGAVQCNGSVGMKGVVDKPSLQRGSQTLRQFNVAVTEEGDYAVYFESRGRLVPEDVNGTHMDTYEWKDGELSLISPGTGAHDAYYSGNGLTGRDVFIQTSQPLDPYREIDPGDHDIYDVRIGGGFPPPPAPPGRCVVLADACQGAGADGDAVKPATNGAAVGGEAPAARQVLRLAAPSAVARRRASRTGILAIKVRSSRAGPVAVVARGRIGKRMRSVGRASMDLTKPGVATLRVRMGRSARRWLRARGTLRLVVVARAPDARQRTLSLLLREVRS